MIRASFVEYISCPRCLLRAFSNVGSDMREDSAVAR